MIESHQLLQGNSNDFENDSVDSNSPLEAISHKYMMLKSSRLSVRTLTSMHMEEEETKCAEEKPLRILCVDDSSYNLFVMMELIKTIDSKIHVDTALNG